jgi:hypothetical protein
MGRQRGAHVCASLEKIPCMPQKIVAHVLFAIENQNFFLAHVLFAIENQNLNLMS